MAFNSGTYHGIKNTSRATEAIKVENAMTENLKLQLQLEALNEVVVQTNALVASESAAMTEKLEGIWGTTLNFLEEVNQFHDQRGISSPWWNAQILSLQNPGVHHAGSTRRQRQKQLDQMKVLEHELKTSVAAKTDQVSKLKEKLVADETMIIELKRMQEELQQEPFGSEFLSMKAKIHKSKESCLQLGALLATRDNRGQEAESATSDNPLHRDLKRSLQQLDLPLPGFKSANPRSERQDEPRTSHNVFKVRQRTTYVYRRQASGFRVDSGDDRGQCYFDAENIPDQDQDVTHS